MTPSYQGRALRRDTRRSKRPHRGWRVAQMVALLLGLAAMAHLPWRELRRRFAAVAEIRVEGNRYLDASRVIARTGITRGDDLLALDPARARQALLLDSRIAAASVVRHPLRHVRVRIEERIPVLLVHHGAPWEIDSAGVLLEPLQSGVVADVPLLVGPRFHRVPPGAHLGGDKVRRGLAWVQALGRRELQLQGEVSEIDVSDGENTGLTLLSGTRVLGPAWPPPLRRLSALRVVLADLGRRGVRADEVDLRFDRQVIVRPQAAAEGTTNG